MVNQLRYSREELFSLKNVKPSTYTRLPDPLHHCLLDNGIARKPRGCRGGDGDRTKHAGVVVSNRHSNVKQAFNYNGRFRAPTLIHILLFRSTFQLLSHKPMTTGTFEFIHVTIALPTNESQHSTTCRIPPAFFVTAPCVPGRFHSTTEQRCHYCERNYHMWRF